MIPFGPTDFYGACFVAECDMLDEMLDLEPGDLCTTLIMLEHVEGEVSGEYTADGRPMASVDWFATHALGFERYARHLQRRALRRLISIGTRKIARGLATPDEIESRPEALAILARLASAYPDDPA